MITLTAVFFIAVEFDSTSGEANDFQFAKWMAKNKVINAPSVCLKNGVYTFSIAAIEFAF